jgi:hypothetical protein
MFLKDLDVFIHDVYFRVIFTLWRMRLSELALIIGYHHVSGHSNIKFIPPRGVPLECFENMWTVGTIRQLEARNRSCTWTTLMEDYTYMFKAALEMHSTQRRIFKGIDDDLLYNELQNKTLTYLSVQAKRLPKTTLWR